MSLHKLLARTVTLFVLSGLSPIVPSQTPSPKLVSQDGRHALLVDGDPYLVLGAQIGNSSAWPSVLPQVWPALEAMHVNTAEAPVYWEQIEPEPGRFDWTNVDALIEGARAHQLHLVLLWFGTWKNGNDHYVPQWVKRDLVHYPRMINRAGNPLDDLSANAPQNMEADQKAFSALMHHIAERDHTEHTILLMQIENESGGIGAARDYSPASDRAFAGQVPADLAKALDRRPGTWTEVFPGNADEAFQAWYQARYVNAVAEAGKREFNIPFYCNVWVTYPPAELPERQLPIAGIGYPSGGPNQGMLRIWKAAAPSIDMIGPDIYSSDAGFVANIMDLYARTDNPLWIPEIGQGDEYAPYLFAALDRSAIGFSPFGIDWTDHLTPGSVPRAHAANFAVLGTMDRTLARLGYEGRVRTLIEVVGGVDQELLFPATSAPAQRSEPESVVIRTQRNKLENAMAVMEGVGTPAMRSADASGAWVAEARFGFPQRDGEHAPGTPHKSGRILIAQQGKDEFLLTGFGGSVFFHRPGLLPGIRMQILTAEEGYYTPASAPGAPEVWHAKRILNGDETDRGIAFPDTTQDVDASSRPRASGNATPPAETHAQRIAVRVVLGRF